jgi:hypothetical protein
MVRWQPGFGVACTPGDPSAPATCYNAAIGGLTSACNMGLATEACIAADVLKQDNFRCISDGAGGGTCGFHPIVYQVNVHPEGLELVFAPDPERPTAQLDRVLRAFSALAMTPICGPPISTATRVNQPVASLQQTSGSAPDADCADEPGPSDPPGTGAPPQVCP